MRYRDPEKEWGWAQPMEAEQLSEKVSIWKDPRTGLEWEAESPGEMTWYEAQAYANALSLDGREDWRLPSARELETLLDRTRYRPVVREEVPFRDSNSYWSSTTFEENTSSAWIVMFNGAYVLSYYKSNAYLVRCVRGSGQTRRE